MGKKQKKFVFICLTTLFSLILFFLVGEMFFRIFRGSPNPLAEIVQKDPSVLFEPNTTLHKKSSKEGEFEYTAHINQFGYRGSDFSAEKDENTLRVFIVGDSFTFGVGAEDDQTIPYLLEKKLKEKGYSVEIINAGIGHSSPVMHYCNLRNIHLQFNPDLVVLLFDLTDLRDDWRWEKHALYNERGEIERFDTQFINGKRDRWITLCHNSSFAKWINNKVVRSYKKMTKLGLKNYIQAAKEGKRAKAVIGTSESDELNEAQIQYDGLIMLRGRKRKDIIDQHWPRTVHYLDKIQQLLKENNIELIIGMYPYGIYVDADQWSEGRKLWGFENIKYDDTYSYEIVEDYADNQNIPFVNTLNDFINAGKGKYFFDWDGHLTPKGNEIVAQSISESPVFLDLMQSLAEDAQ